MEQRHLVVPLKDQGKRLDIVILGLLGDDFSRSQVQRLLRQGLVTVAGEKARSSLKVKQGQKVIVTIPDPEEIDLTPKDLNLDILYEDDHLVVVNKPNGMVVHPACGNYHDTLVHGLLYHCKGLAQIGGQLRPGIVHRLDKDTTGVLVAAKSDIAHRGLVTAFAAGRVKKQYLALVCGYPPMRGENTEGIGRHPIDRKRMSTKAKHVKSAKTLWQVTRRFKADYSMLKVRIKTGRTHQIRVHMSEMGFPVAGDPVYGRKKSPKDEIAKEIKALKRQLLHAYELGFTHPVTHEKIKVMAPLPADFRRILRMLETC